MSQPVLIQEPPSNEDGSTMPPAVLGIDLGMTATRASIMRLDCKDNPDQIPIAIPRPPAHWAADQNHAGDFPATAYPLKLQEAPERCLGYAADAHASPFPLKMFFYFQHFRALLSENETSRAENLRRNLPQIDALWKQLSACDADHQQRVADHLESIFRYHLRTVREHSERTAASKGWRITKLAITLPPSWNSHLQTMYTDILGQIWDDLATGDITKIYESEAVAHWLLRQDVRWQTDSAKQLLVADFGGHTLNVQVFGILRRAPGAKFAFFTTEDGWTQHGGSEFHISLVKSKLEAKIQKSGLQLTKDEFEHILKDCMKHYRDDYRSKVDGSSFYLEGARKRGSRKPRDHFRFNYKESEAMYKTAFGTPLSELVVELKKQAKVTKDTTVVLTGGSFLNSEVSEEMIKAIKKAGLTHNPWVNEMGNPQSRSSMISAGAALAVANSLTVEEFMDNAVFAVDTCKRKVADLTVLPVALDDNEILPRVAYYKTARPRSFLVSSPVGSLDKKGHVPRSNTYEFYSLGPAQGRLGYSLAYKKEMHDGEKRHLLILTQTLEKTHTPSAPKVVRIPIYYDPGACVCFPDWDIIKTLNTSDGDGQTASTAPRRNRQKQAVGHHELWESHQQDNAAGQWELTLNQAPQDRHQTGASTRNSILQAEQDEEDILDQVVKFATQRVTSSPRRAPAERRSAGRPSPLATKTSRSDSPATIRNASTAPAEQHRFHGVSIDSPWEIPDDDVASARNPLKRPAEEPLSPPRSGRAPYPNMGL